MSDIEPAMSCLFANTRREAPASLWICDPPQFSERLRKVNGSGHSPLLEVNRAARPCNLAFSFDPLNRRPTRAHRFVQSSFANMVVVSVDLRRPLMTEVSDLTVTFKPAGTNKCSKYIYWNVTSVFWGEPVCEKLTFRGRTS